MLVLARKAGQSIKIGDSITIKVMAFRGSSVRIGIEAPRHLAVVRDDAKPIITAWGEVGADDENH